MDTDKVWKFLGSRWVMLIIALIFIAIFPALYHNIKVVLTYPDVPTRMIIQHGAVLIIDVITIILALFKFMNMTFKDKGQQVKNETSEFN